MIENRRKARSPAKAIELESQESAKKKKELTPQEEAIKKAESERITKKIYKWNYIYLIMIYIFNFVAWGVVNTNSSHYLNLAKVCFFFFSKHFSFNYYALLLDYLAIQYHSGFFLPRDVYRSMFICKL